MRPTKLTMKAFGSYADETIVDFDSLTGGLYLIVGKTGAGKTTIFDAISFALFGVPSGSERKTEMLHSDFVPLSEDTEVTLDFVHQGREYHVERKLHFRKKRGSEEYGDANVSAVMTGSEQNAIEGATRVTSRCEELLGLNSEQFHRIVMLAQGEFREFLKAGSDKKNEILGRLFDNSEYLRFQNLLYSVEKKLEQKRQEHKNEIDTVMKTVFKLPPELEDEAENYLPGHPRLVENLQALVELEQSRLDALKEENSRMNKTVQELTRMEGAAATDNAHLNELEEKRSRLLSLEEQKDTFASRKGKYIAAEKAFHRIKPKESEASWAADSLKKAQEEIKKLENLQIEQKAALTEAEALAESDEPKQRRVNDLSAEIAKLNDALPYYGQEAEKQAELKNILIESAKAKDGLDEIKGRQDALDKKLADIRDELTELDGCEAEEVRTANERDAAEERWKAVSEPGKGMSALVDKIIGNENSLNAESAILSLLTSEAADAEEHYHTLYQAFLGGQAGLIAVKMENELAEEGKTVCPVCNTSFCREEAHCFALPTEQVPEEKDVKKAEKAAKDAEKKRRDKQAKLDMDRRLLSQQKDTVVKEMQKLEPDCKNWGMLIAPGWLASLQERLKQSFAEKEKSWIASQEKCERRKTLQTDENIIADEQKELANRRSEENDRLEELERKAHGLDSALVEIRKHFPYPTEAEVSEKYEALTKEQEDLLKEIEGHKQALEAARKDLDITSGGLNALCGSLPGLQEASEKAEKLLYQALLDNGFEDIEVAHAALEPIGEADGEQWLLAEKEAQDNYAHDLDDTRKRIEELTVQTDGKALIDLEELRSQLDEATSAERRAADAMAAHASSLDGYRFVAEKVSAAKAELSATDRAFRRISRLAEMGIGASGEGGKLSFDRYVMGAIFREVLEMANRRLNIMTGGRFELIHSIDAGRKNASAGLEIDVLDVTSGKQRASGSISGGEGFMVSLALALGLSDVVQSHAGGQKLDTLFIDEGFGSLDYGKLDNVISVLQQMTEGNRLVGIISHVDKLEESIPQKLRVTSTEHGSTIALELS